MKQVLQPSVIRISDQLAGRRRSQSGEWAQWHLPEEDLYQQCGSTAEAQTAIDAKLEASVKKHPLIAMGTPDPYTPPQLEQ